MNALSLTPRISPYADPGSANYTKQEFIDAVHAYLKGDQSVAIGCLENLRATYQSSDAILEYQEVLYLLTQSLLANGDLERAESVAVDLLQFVESRIDDRWRGLGLHALANVNIERGHASYATDLAQRAKELFVASGKPVDIARACQALGTSFLMMGDIAASKKELQIAVSLSTLTDDQLVAAVSLRRLGFCFVQEGRYEEAASAYQEALEAYSALGARQKALNTLHSLAVLSISRGDLPGAHTYIDMAQPISPVTVGRVNTARWQTVTAWLAVLEGDSTRALHELNLARRAFESSGAQRDEALCLEFRGDALRVAGQLSQAEDAYAEAIEQGCMVSQCADIVVECLRKRGELLVGAGRIADAVRDAHAAGRGTRKFSDKSEIAAILRLRGLIKIRRGKKERGLELLQAAWEQLEHMGARLEAKVTAQLVAKILEDEQRGQESIVWRRLGGTEELPTLKLLLPKKGRAADVVPPRTRVLKHLAQHAEKHGIVTRDPRVLKAFEQAVRGAPSHLPFLILGETGTGKELLAAVAHRFSERAGAFIAINCAALPPDLLDAELFGHARGAYTGALRERAGLIESATEGTLFLDEVGEMSLPVQGRLLRAIEQGEIRRLGENRPRTVTTRFIAATHRDLQDMVLKGAFRSDLFFRLRGITVVLPPLRERVWDVDLLLDHFLARESEKKARSFVLTTEARERLRAHAWPGNVRELRSVIERLGSMHDRDEPIDVDDLALDPVRVAGSLEEHLEDEERKRLIATLESVQWNRSRAARVLNLKRTTLLGKMKRLGISVPSRK